MNGKRSSPPSSRVDESGVIQALGPRDLSMVAPIGKYRFLGVLGHGGMADVYLAMADGPEGFRKLCVVKMMKEAMASDEDFRAMFVDEARLAARLSHPNIVQTYEVDSVDGHLLLAMEYVEGTTLARVRRRMPDGTFPLEATVRILCDVLDALSYAHGALDFDGRSLEIVHRDVSPHNIIVGYTGNVKLLDFGIAKSTAAIQATQAGVLKGKVGYMAPEQASFRDVDQRADLFSVGVILWEAIAGRRLAEGSSSHASLMRRVQGEEPRIEEIVPEVDPELARIVGRALETDPDARYSTADEMQSELEAWLVRRTELPRRMWASAVAQTFDDERRKFQALANLRASDPSIQTAQTAREARSARPPQATVPLIPVEQASVFPPPLTASAAHDPHQLGQGIHVARTAPPLAPGARAPSPLGGRVPLLVGVLTLAALVVGLVAYVASGASGQPVPSASASTASSTKAPGSAETAITSGTSGTSGTMGTGAGAGTTGAAGTVNAAKPADLPSAPDPVPMPNVVPQNRGGIVRHGPAPVAPPPQPQQATTQAAASASTRPTRPSAETPRPAVSGARALDERDPYAP